MLGQPGTNAISDGISTQQRIRSSKDFNPACQKIFLVIFQLQVMKFPKRIGAILSGLRGPKIFTYLWGISQRFKILHTFGRDKGQNLFVCLLAYRLNSTRLLKAIFSQQYRDFKNVLIEMGFFRWDSLHARLNSHYKPWSYRKKKHEDIKAYRKSLYKEPTVNRCLLIPDLKPVRLQLREKHSIGREFQSQAM